MRTRISVLLLLSSAAYAASLKQESVQAWDRYVATAEAKVKARAKGNATFLWVDESPDRRRRVQNGEIVVFETPGGNRKAPGALIHDWSGAAFIAGAKIDDVISILRNYNAYPDYYQPHVLSSKTIAKDNLNDRFSVLFMNQALVTKTAIETEGQATYTQLSDKRWYGETSATRIQEIEDYGHSSQHRLPVGEGSGFLWRLESFTRFEERDGGVYVELQVLALSRDIPISLRFVVDPIVRRVSRNSLAESLAQTGKAVTELVARDRDEVESKVASVRETPAPVTAGGRAGHGRREPVNCGKTAET